MNIIHYIKWCRAWHIDFASDNWRDESDKRWAAFQRWERGELPTDIKTAVMSAQLGEITESIWDTANRIMNAMTLFSASLVDVFTPFAEQASASMEAIAASFERTMGHHLTDIDKLVEHTDDI